MCVCLHMNVCRLLNKGARLTSLKILCAKLRDKLLCVHETTGARDMETGESEQVCV